MSTVLVWYAGVSNFLSDLFVKKSWVIILVNWVDTPHITLNW